MEKGRTTKDSLMATLNAINNYDNKASALLTAVGIIFGFSMFSVSELAGKEGSTLTAIYIVGSCYLIVFILLIIFLVSIVFPRRRTKKEKEKAIDFPLYTEDLYAHLKSGDIKEFITKNMDESAIIDQVKNCSRIAHKKECLLRLSTFLIVAFGCLLISLVVLMFL